MLKIIRFVMPFKGMVILNFFYNGISACFSLFSVTMAIPFLNVLFGIQPVVTELIPFSFRPAVIKEILSYHVGQFITSIGEVNALIAFSLMAVIASFLKNGFKYLALRQMAYIRNNVAKSIRQNLYNKSLDLPMAYYARERKGDIMSRMTNDVSQVESSLISSLEMILREPVTVLVFFIALLALSPQLTIFVVLLLPVSAFIIARVAKNLRSASREGQSKLGLLLSIMEESISGLRVVKAFNAEDRMKNRFEQLNKRFTAIMNRIYMKQYLASPLSEFLGTAVVVAIMIFGGTLVVTGNSGFSASTLIGYLLMFSMVINPAKHLSQAYYNIQKGLASVDRVMEMLNAEENMVNTANSSIIEKFKEEIQLSDVTFRYDHRDVLKNINLSIKRGQVVALVGHSGAGKTTLVDLIMRFHDTSSGQILIDGKPLKELDVRSWRELVGYVNQEPILFNDTVFNNIAFGANDATFDEVVNAATIANAHQFILGLPQGYDTAIGDRGSNLSGGERQRLSIARAVLKNPPVLVLDEATSALDTESEKLVQEAIYNVMKNRTVIVIAHRLSTITYSNFICVLQYGEIIEQGSHAELLKKKGLYRKLNDLQIFGEQIV